MSYYSLRKQPPDCPVPRYSKRISLLSSEEQTFQETAPLYQNALRHSNFNHKLGYMKETPQQARRRNSQRSIIWFNPCSFQ